jgi:hypothetical protein
MKIFGTRLLIFGIILVIFTNLAGEFHLKKDLNNLTYF